MELDLHKALPARYEVTRRGTPDPDDARYVVLNHAHDVDARVALRFYARTLHTSGRVKEAEELVDALEESLPTFKAHIEAKNPAQKTKGRRRR